MGDINQQLLAIKPSAKCQIPQGKNRSCPGTPSVAIRASDGLLLACDLCYMFMRRQALAKRIELQIVQLEKPAH